MDNSNIDNGDPKNWTPEDWKLFAALKNLRNKGRKSSDFRPGGRRAAEIFQVFQGSENGSFRKLAVFDQESEEGTDYHRRSFSMGVDNISEVMGLFEVFFKLGLDRHSDTPNVQGEALPIEKGQTKP